MKHNLIRHGHMLRIKSILSSPRMINETASSKPSSENDCGMPDTMRIINETWKWFVRDGDNFVLAKTNKRGDHRDDAEVKDFSIFKKHYYKKASALGIVG